MNKPNESKSGFDRRDLLKGAAVAGLGMATGAIGAPKSAEYGKGKRDLIREENAKPGASSAALTI